VAATQRGLGGHAADPEHHDNLSSFLLQAGSVFSVNTGTEPK
jgi:hypothetical protein